MIKSIYNGTSSLKNSHFINMGVQMYDSIGREMLENILKYIDLADAISVISVQNKNTIG